jgi:hypothetical protein
MIDAERSAAAMRNGGQARRGMAHLKVIIKT